MATSDWRSGRDLKKSLADNYHHFDFYQLIHLLLSEKRGKSESGSGADGIDDVVAISSDTGCDFAPSEVVDLTRSPSGHGPSEIKLATFSIAGRTGPLPEPYKERFVHGNSGMSAFLDIFNHRLNSLRFKNRQRSHPGLSTNGPGESYLSELVRNTAGFGTDYLEGRWPLSSRELMLFGGVLSAKRRGAPVIRNIVAHYLETRVEISQFQESWHALDPDDRTHAGVSGGNNRLGKTAVLGGRYCDRQSRIKMTCGPLSYKRFMQLIPGGEKHDEFEDLILFLTDKALDCTVVLTLLRKDIPPSRLPGPSRRGNSSWLWFEKSDNGSMILKRNAWLNRGAVTSRDMVSTEFTIRVEEEA